jgi:hypothetical protein
VTSSTWRVLVQAAVATLVDLPLPGASLRPRRSRGQNGAHGRCLRAPRPRPERILIPNRLSLAAPDRTGAARPRCNDMGPSGPNEAQQIRVELILERAG